MTPPPPPATAKNPPQYPSTPPLSHQQPLTEVSDRHHVVAMETLVTVEFMA